MNELEKGRESFARQAWGDAFAQLSAADRQAPLSIDDLERLSTAAYLTGRDAEHAEVLARAHQECAAQGDPARAARCAFWLAFGLMNRGEMAQAGGWLARAERLLEACGQDCVERGFVLLPTGLRLTDQGDYTAAYETFEEAGRAGERFRDLDLGTLARLGKGQALLRQGSNIAGMALLDEAMVAVTTGEASPVVAGLVYCAVISACQETFDLRRAQEWTAVLSRWCESQPDLVPYRGQCLVHRAQIMQLHGAWQDAISEAQQACERLSVPPGHPATGAAYYQQAELYRLRGETARAEEAYRQASRWGHKPEPGLALLRLAQGQVDAAAAILRRALDETRDRLLRTRLLPAYVEVLLVTGDAQAARAAADELHALAEGRNAPLLQAMAAQAQGAVSLAEGQAQGALALLRRAWTAWREMDAPYEGARVRVLIGLACRRLGDEDTAEMELDAAQWVFRQLGAAPDLERVEALLRRGSAKAPGGLTEREAEVLRLLAAGKTNRTIAGELFISEKTVARHVANIFEKLGLSSRSAATAYAYEHGLLSRPT